MSMPPPLNDEKWLRFTLPGQPESSPCEYYEHVCDPDIIVFRSCSKWACLIYRRHLYTISLEAAPDWEEMWRHIMMFRQRFQYCYHDESQIEPEVMYAVIGVLDDYFRAPVTSLLPKRQKETT